MAAGTTDLIFQDPLTGLYNRRYLTLLLEQRWRELVRVHPRVTLLLLDLDAFKEINDTHGHLTGDEVLRATARVLHEHFRESDIIARYGGDEFLIISPDAGRDEAAELAARARMALGAQPLLSRATGRADIRPEFSIGVGSYPEDGSTAEEVLAAADRRLYEDKRVRGRMRPRRIRRPAAIAGGIALLAFGVLAGSFYGARVRTVVTPLLPRRAVTPTRSATPLPDATALAARVAELEAHLASLTPSGSPQIAATPEPPASQIAAARIAELELEVRSLRARLDAYEGPLGIGAGASTGTGPGGARRPARSPLPTPARRPASPDPASTPETPPATQVRSALDAVEPSSRVSALEAGAGAEGAPEEAVASADDELVMPPQALREVRPYFPRIARALRRSATVEVRVTVDATGRVSEARALPPRAGLGFDEAAEDAARRTPFRPATRGHGPLETTTVLRYMFVYE